MKNDKTVVCKAVKQNGLALQFASDKLKNDKTIVCKAVQQNGLALQFASVELKNDVTDDTVVFKAVQQNGLALQYAGKAFWKCKISWIQNHIKEDGTLFVFHNIKEEDGQRTRDSNTGTRKYITNFVNRHFNDVLLSDNLLFIYPFSFIKNVNDYFTDEQLKKMFKVSMSIYQLDEEFFAEEKRYLIRWYRESQKLIDSEFIEYAVKIDGMLLNQAYLYNSSLKKMENYIDILKNAAIQNINIIKEKKLTNDLDYDQLIEILQEPTKQNSKKVMEILSSFYLISSPWHYRLFLDNLINPAIKSNWESLEYIMKSIKWYVENEVYFVNKDERNLWDPVYMAVNENFSAIQYIKDKLLIININ